MNNLLAMLGWQELWPVLIVVLLLFGAKRLPELARSMGEGIKEFKKGLREVTQEEETPKSKELSQGTPDN
jgi:sec-independent protein translocase protein TatA